MATASVRAGLGAVALIAVALLLGATSCEAPCKDTLDCEAHTVTTSGTGTTGGAGAGGGGAGAGGGGAAAGGGGSPGSSP
jgi:hypothetical protein